DANGGRQIADFEPDNGYTYRLNGYNVEAYWSVNDLAFIVPDGKTQTVTLTPIWTQDTTIPSTKQWSFQFAYKLSVHGQSITLDSASGNLSVNVDGGQFQFDAGTIHNITLNTGAATDTVTIKNLPADPSSLTINLGSGTDTVNVESLPGSVLLTVNLGS